MLAAIYVATDATARMTLQGPKFWQVKHVRADGVDSAKRFAESWCAVRYMPDLPLRKAVREISG